MSSARPAWARAPPGSDHATAAHAEPEPAESGLVQGWGAGFWSLAASF